MIRWVYYPKSDKPPQLAVEVVRAFEAVTENIDSKTHKEQQSNEALKKLAAVLQAIGFKVESGKKKGEKISVPVLFGEQGRPEKTFDADAYHAEAGFVLEVEAGRGVEGNQFLKDLFQACMMHEVHYLAIAVRNSYRKGDNFETVMTFFETLYASRRLQLPLRGILLIGY
jgi:hypothetical protein